MSERAHYSTAHILASLTDALLVYKVSLNGVMSLPRCGVITGKVDDGLSWRLHVQHIFVVRK